MVFNQVPMLFFALPSSRERFSYAFYPGSKPMKILADGYNRHGLNDIGFEE